AILVPLVIPLRTLDFGQEDVGATPKSTTQRQAYDLMAAGFGVGYNGPLLVAVELGTPAKESSEVKSQKQQAQSLQKQLEQEQKQGTNEQKQLEQQQGQLEQEQGQLEQQQGQLEQQQGQLEQQQQQLESEQAALEAEASELTNEQSQLRAAGARLKEQQARVTSQLKALAGREKQIARAGSDLRRNARGITDDLRRARALAAQERRIVREGARLGREAARLARELARTRVRERVLEARLRRVRLPGERARLEARLARLETQQQQLESRLDRVLQQEQALRRQSQTVFASVRTLRSQLESQLESILRQEQALRRQSQAVFASVRTLRSQLESQLQSILRREQALRTQSQALLARSRTLRGQERAIAQRGVALASEAASLAKEAKAVVERKQDLVEDAASLQVQGAQLQTKGANLQTDAAKLQTQKVELQEQQQQAKAQQQQAEQLQQQLTDELTKAGGDARGTDPRLVKLQDALAGTDGIKGVSPPNINKAGNAAVFSAIATTAPAAPETADLVRTLRTYVIPQAITGTDLDAFVGGQTASYVDLAAGISSRLLFVILAVVALTFLVLLTAFRSLLVAAQAALTNVVSVAAAFGVLTACFQWGWGLGLVGLDTASGTDPIASYVPLMMFAVLFGLSMDYQVFLLSQIEHHRAQHESDRQAVASGLEASARVIAAAALIMMSVFGSFILNGDPTVKQFGVGLAVGVALAATSVLLLAPALLVLAAQGSWWVPRWLDRVLPHLDIEGARSQPAGEVRPTVAVPRARAD
ncbi:MAG: MMPL family transporter, partial [Actinomycetota bacterium]|nr:MMPL family transporter [Actinomycetota bacterium]